MEENALRVMYSYLEPFISPHEVRKNLKIVHQHIKNYEKFIISFSQSFHFIFYIKYADCYGEFHFIIHKR